MAVIRHFTCRLTLASLAMLALLSAGAQVGCSIDLTGLNPGNGGGDVDTNGMPEPQPDPGATVTVRFANQTDAAVLADLFVSTDGFSTSNGFAGTNGFAIDPDAIFMEDNRYVTGIGLAATGVLIPQSTDAVDIPCETGMFVATSGGAFRDPDSGEELGTGPARILQEGLVFDCGAEITFVYREVDSAYTVIVTLN